MIYYKHTTQVPNHIFTLLPDLTEAELKTLLFIVRQTLGWIDKRTGKRKLTDRIFGSQFRLHTGLSKRIINKAIKSLIARNLIEVTGTKGIVLHDPTDRQGVVRLHYGLSPQLLAILASEEKIPVPVNGSDHNKTKDIKQTEVKPRRTQTVHIRHILPRLDTNSTTGS